MSPKTTSAFRRRRAKSAWRSRRCLEWSRIWKRGWTRSFCRAVVLTEAGTEFLARMEPILTALEDAKNSVRESGELRGLLRVGMTTTMGLRVVMPRLAPFTERHPNLHVELLLDDKWQDMVREAVDVGIRVGNLPDGAGTSRFNTTMPRVVVGSPSYLGRAGVLIAPEDLTRHRIVGGPTATHAASWQFEREGKKVSIELQPNISTNTIAGAIACETGGLGITSAPVWGFQDELERALLVHVLAGWNTTGLPVHGYLPLGRSTRKVAWAFVEFISEELRKQ